MKTGVPAGFDSASLTIFQAVELFFDTGTVWLWNGIGDLVIDGSTYAGAGDLLGITLADEDESLSAKGISIQLSGVSSTMISYALNEHYKYRTVKVRIGTITAGVVASYQVFSGRMDVMTFDDTGDTSTVTLTAESRFIDFDRIRDHRWTSEDQKALYPGDKAFDGLNVLQEAKIQWGG
jgi:hypothetical protein